MKPIWKWVIGILVLIVVALAGVSWYLSRNWKPIVEEQLKELVKSSTDSLYRLTYEDLDMTVALGNVTLKNVLLKPDTQVYARMEAAELAPDNLYDIEIKELKVKRFGILNMLRNRELHIKSIDLTEPRIHLTNKYHAYNDTIATEKPKKSLYESIKGVLNAVNIGRIDIERAAFRLTKLNEDSVSTNFGLDSLQIRAEDILIDEHAQADTSRLYYTRSEERRVGKECRDG